MSSEINPSSSSQILVTASGGAAATLQFPTLAIRLDHTNYTMWKGTITSALEAYELDHHLVSANAPNKTIPPKPSSTTTEATPNPQYVSWKRNDRLVLLWLRSTLTAPLLGHVARATTSADV